jgi:hypothetical protein
VYLLKLSSECLVSYDPHFPGNDGTNNTLRAIERLFFSFQRYLARFFFLNMVGLSRALVG